MTVTPVTRNDEQVKLTALEHRLHTLVTRRNSIVTAARAAIDEANGQFDEAAIPVRREIEQIRASLPKPAKPKRQQARPVNTAGLTHEEIEHMRRLAK